MDGLLPTEDGCGHGLGGGGARVVRRGALAAAHDLLERAPDADDEDRQAVQARQAARPEAQRAGVGVVVADVGRDVRALAGECCDGAVEREVRPLDEGFEIGSLAARPQADPRAESLGGGAISACSVSRMDQPTILRVCRSRTAARNSQPSQVADMGQITEPHAGLGAAASKLRPSRLGAIGYPCRLSPVAHPARQRRQAPQPRPAHQPGHPVAPDPPAEGPQDGVHARRPRQVPPLPGRGPRGWRPAGRGSGSTAGSRAVSATREWPLAETPRTRHITRTGHCPRCSSQRPERHRVAPPKMSAAFFEMSRSIRARSSSRRPPRVLGHEVGRGRARRRSRGPPMPRPRALLALDPAPSAASHAARVPRPPPRSSSRWCAPAPPLHS